MATAPDNKPLTVRPGAPLPFGVRLGHDGANFAIFGRHAEAVTLLLFTRVEDTEPRWAIGFDPTLHRTGDIWHAWVEGVGPGWAYAYRVAGPWMPDQGLWYNTQKVLIDPLAVLVHGAACWDFAAARAGEGDEQVTPLPNNIDNLATAGRGLIVDSDFDWEGDRPLRLPWSRIILYETHVRGFTIHPSSGVSQPGTYRGLVEKIPYLKELGVTAVELMPVQEFNENELGRHNPLTGERLRNYWGYSPIGFIAPKASYASDQRGAGPLLEFKEMVKALHRAGIEIFLDVVFNHTAEGNESGPMLHLRGLDNPIFYRLQPDARHYRDDTGCGNTLNCNHPVVRELILDALRYWVLEMHVDGFRFDLAAVLGRDEAGHVMANAPLLSRLAEDPILREVKLIAEAWDAGGAYELGYFCCNRWSEWNGRYRDEVRRFWRGDPGMAGALASRLAGSSDIFRGGNKEPFNSINLITCHDGFTLNDLVSYQHKRNQANGEDNRDGTSDNFSFNCGIEGPTDDPAVEVMRRRQIKNLIATLLLSRGVPMLLGGDEFRRSQNGNNNAYCQDNETSWYDWSLTTMHREIHQFSCAMTAFRRRHPLLCEEQFYSDPDVTWFDAEGHDPDWSAPNRHLGCYFHPRSSAPDEVCLLCNAEARALEFTLSALRGEDWRIAVDTAAKGRPEHEHACSARLSLASFSLIVLERVP